MPRISEVGQEVVRSVAIYEPDAKRNKDKSDTSVSDFSLLLFMVVGFIYHQNKVVLRAMNREAGLITFSDVSFEYNHNKPTLIGANFVIRRGAKLTLMGQNGAGKSTIFGLITEALKPTRVPLTSCPALLLLFHDRSFREMSLISL